MKTLDKYCH